MDINTIKAQEAVHVGIAQQTQVHFMEIADAPCKCIIYHPPYGDEWDRVYENWVATGKSSMMMIVQLFGHCPNREEN